MTECEHEFEEEGRTAGTFCGLPTNTIYLICSKCGKQETYEKDVR